MSKRLWSRGLKRGTAFFLLFLISGCSAKVRIVISASADVVTTEMVVNHGGHEVNTTLPFDTTAKRIAWKVGLVAYLIFLHDWLENRDHFTAAKIVEWIAVGWNLIATGWNISEIAEWK